MSPRQNSRGSTLLEVVMAMSLITILMMTLVSLTIVGVSRNRTSKEKMVATRLAQETAEWLRYERERVSFDLMSNMIDTYCANVFPVENGAGGGVLSLSTSCGANSAIPSITPAYSRTIKLSKNSNTIIAYEVTVSWEGTTPQMVKLNGTLSKWRK